MRILEDFIHLIGEAQKPFQSFLVVTNNLSKYHRGLVRHRTKHTPSRSQFACGCPVITIQREPVSAVSSAINFPMKGRRGMKDWARTAEDKLYIPKEVFTNPTDGTKARGAFHETQREVSHRTNVAVARRARTGKARGLGGSTDTIWIVSWRFTIKTSQKCGAKSTCSSHRLKKVS